MNKTAKEFVEFIISDHAPQGNKSTVIDIVKNKFHLIKDRSVYYCNFFAVRFSYSKTGSFSNTILSLSHLQKYDRIPFFVVLIIAGKSNIVYLANSTFLSKISHSSKNLTLDNIRGSFNGSDIVKQYNGINNKPNEFSELYAIHEGLDWTDNLRRLVDASSEIKPKSEKFNPTDIQLINILNSVDKAKEFILSDNFSVLNTDLQKRCKTCREAIWVASRIDNVNIRGRIIEAMITAQDDDRDSIIKNLKELEHALPVYDTKNELGDYNRTFDNGNTYTDIKTKVIYLNSAPKAYNIDKFLAKMSEKNSIFFFFFIGIDENGICSTKLCSVYHKELIETSIIQHHWAGRSTRGVVQFDGKTINAILHNMEFKNEINKDISKKYLSELLAR